MAAAPRWKLNHQARLSWRTWDDESVVFNSQSGDTHQLDLVAREGLLCLSEESLNAAELRHRLASRLEVDDDLQLERYVDQLLFRLVDLGLLEQEMTRP